MIERFDTILHGVKYNSIKEDKQEVLRRFLDKQSMRCLLPKFARDVKNTKRKLALLKTSSCIHAVESSQIKGKLVL